MTFVSQKKKIFGTWSSQRHRDRRPSTTSCPGFWAMGTNKVIKFALRKIIPILYGTGLTRAAKAGQKSLVPARRVQRTNEGRTVHFESPFTSVSTVSRDRPSLQSLWEKLLSLCWLVLLEKSSRTMFNILRLFYTESYRGRSLPAWQSVFLRVG